MTTYTLVLCDGTTFTDLSFEEEEELWDKHSGTDNPPLRSFPDPMPEYKAP